MVFFGEIFLMSLKTPVYVAILPLAEPVKAIGQLKLYLHLKLFYKFIDYQWAFPEPETPVTDKYTSGIFTSIFLRYEFLHFE